MSIQRSPLLQTTSYEEVYSAITSLQPRTLVIDVEPLVCQWKTGQEQLDDGLRSLLSRLREDEQLLQRIWFLTNSARVPSKTPASDGIAVTYVTNARKPWLRLDALRSSPSPIVVVGDQVLTDGCLAWRLKAPFVQVPIPRGASSAVRTQRQVGDILRRCLFSRPG